MYVSIHQTAQAYTFREAWIWLTHWEGHWLYFECICKQCVFDTINGIYITEELCDNHVGGCKWVKGQGDKCDLEIVVSFAEVLAAY